MKLDELEILATVWRTYSTSVPAAERQALAIDETVGEAMFGRIDGAIGPLDRTGGFLIVGTPRPRTTDVFISDDELRVTLEALRALRRAVGDEEFEILTGFTAQEAMSCVDGLLRSRSISVQDRADVARDEENREGMTAKPGTPSPRASERAVRWATEACGQLFTEDVDYAQADIDELVTLRGGKGLAPLSLELFSEMVRGTIPMHAPFLMELTIPFPTPPGVDPGDATYTELLDAILYPTRLRGFHVPGFSIDRRRPELPLRAGKVVRASCGSFHVESVEVVAEHAVTVRGHPGEPSEHRLVFSKAPTGLAFREARIPPFT